MTTSFPVGGRAIVKAMVAKFPQLFVNEDEKQRELTTKIGEQFAFTFGPRWGNKKSAGLSDEFRSKDSIAVQEADGTTSVWDLFSSGLAILVNDGDMPVPGTHANLPPSEAAFMPCEPRDRLGLGGGQSPEPDNALRLRVERLEKLLDTKVGFNEFTSEASRQDRERNALEMRVAHTEAELAKPLSVEGRTASAGPRWLSHGHDVKLEVTRRNL